MSDAPSTHPSIFVRLCATGARLREIAWEEFDLKYRPVIVGFARRLGLTQADSEEVAQEVMVGFYARSPTFVYDPSRGRFRHYLRTCTRHAVQKRFVRRDRSIDADPKLADDLTIEQVWNDVWELESLRQAIESLREQMHENRSFQAFERFVMFEEPAQQVADTLSMHLNSVYRAKDQMLQQLQRKLHEVRLDLD